MDMTFSKTCSLHGHDPSVSFYSCDTWVVVVVVVVVVV
jgi:hypothetical protein